MVFAVKLSCKDIKKREHDRVPFSFSNCFWHQWITEKRFVMVPCEVFTLMV